MMKKSRQPTNMSSGGAANPLLAFIVIILVILIAVAAFAQTTSRPSYCSRCHVMKPYFDSWSESTHSKVGCIKCHYSYGTNNALNARFIGVRMLLKNMTSSFRGRRPWAEVEDSSCKRPGCHPDASLPEKVALKNVQFAHMQHLDSAPRGKHLPCTSCHAEMVHYTRTKASHETCYLCHLMPVKGQTIASTYTSNCKFCHTAPEGIIKKNGIEVNHLEPLTASLECTQCHRMLTSGDGSVPAERCVLCHADPSVAKRYDETAFIHDTHVTARNMECLRCHTPIVHKMPDIENPIPADCSLCHPEHHKDSLQLYNAYSLGEGERYSSPEFVSHIGCTACHIQKNDVEGKGTVYIANSQACIQCHHSKYGNFLEEWKLATQSLANEVKAEMLIARGKIDESPLSTKRKEELNRKLNDASRKLQIVDRGKGVHNIRYSDSLIRQAHDTINETLVDMNAKPIQSGKIEAYRFASTQECTGCHYGTAAYTGMFSGITFSHVPHLAKGKVPCTECHEYVSRWEPHGKLKFTDSEGCKKCHGSGAGCQSCHKGFEQNPISVFGKTFIHNPHITGAQLMCLDCHLVEAGNIKHGQLTLQKASDCTTCHHGAKQARLCADCHSVQTALEEAKIPAIDANMKTTITHNFHCTKCHDMTQNQTRTVIAAKCAGCHDDSYVKYIDIWLTNGNDSLKEIGNLIVRAQQLEMSDEQKETLARIIERHDYLVKDSKPGVHNPNLWKAIIDKDRSTLRKWLGER